MNTLVFGVIGLAASVASARAAHRVELSRRVGVLRARSTRRLPRPVRAWLERALFDADVQLQPEQALLSAVGAVLAAVIVASSLAPGLLLPVALGASAAGPVFLHAGRHRRARRFDAELPKLVDRVGAELRGGGTVAQALAHAAHDDGPVGTDMRRVVRRVDLGLGLSDSLGAWARERRHHDVTAVAGGLAIASSLGGRAAGALDGLAGSLRQRADAHAEMLALSAQARLSALVVGGAPVGFVAVGALVDPSSVSVLVGTPLGRMCLVGGAVLEALGAWWIHRIVRSEPTA